MTKAFFAAADQVAEEQRPAVIKAALVLIRDELKAKREKAASIKAKAKTPPKAAKKPAPFVAKMKAKPKKAAPVRRGRKPQAPVDQKGQDSPATVPSLDADQS